MKHVFFLIVNYNQYDDCIQYIKDINLTFNDCSSFSTSVYVCDNSVDANRRQDIRDVIIDGDVFSFDNAGYISGLQAAYAKAGVDTRAADSIVILSNPDIRLPKDFSQSLSRLNVTSSCGLCGPSIICDGLHQNPNKKKRPRRLWFVIQRLEFSNFLFFVCIRFLKLVLKKVLSFAPKPTKENLQSDLQAMEEVYLLHGSFMITTSENIALTDCLNEDIFLWGEEALIRHSFIKHGLPIQYAPSVVVFHNEHTSTRLIASKEKYQIWKDSYDKYKRIL